MGVPMHHKPFHQGLAWFKRIFTAMPGLLLLGIIPTQASANPVPRPYVVKPAGCDGFADYSDEFQLSGFHIVETLPQGDGTDIVRIAFDASNQDQGNFTAATLIPNLTDNGLGIIADATEPATLPAAGPLGTASTATTLNVRLPSASVSEFMDQLSSGQIPFTVHADEQPVKKIDYQVVPWDAVDEEAYQKAVESGKQTDVPAPPYTNNQTLEFTLLYVGGIGNFRSAFTVVGNHLYITEDDVAYPLTQVPVVLRNVRVTKAISDFWEGPDGNGNIISGEIWYITAKRTLDDPVTDLVQTGSFCTGRSAYIDQPVSASRLMTIDGDTTDPAKRDKNPQPLRFNNLDMTSGVSVSGQIQGHILKPQVEFRIRQGKLRFVSSFDTDLSLSAQLRAQAAGSVEHEVPLYKLCFPVATLPVGPININLNLQLQHWIGVQGQVSAGMVTGIEKHFHHVHTIGFDGRLPAGSRFFSNAYDIPEPVSFTPPQLTVDTGASVGVYTRIRPTLRIGNSYPDCSTGMGTYAEINAYGRLAVNPTTDPWWNMSYGSSVLGGVDLQLFGLNIADHQTAPSIFPGGESRGAPASIAAAAAAAIAGRQSGEDQRWAVAVDDLNTPNGFDVTSITGTMADNGVLIASHEVIANRNRLVKLDRYGAYQWGVKYRGGYQPVKVLELPDGSIAVAGRVAWLARHDADGNLLWNRDYQIGSVNGGTSARCALNSMGYVEESPGQYGFLLVGQTVLDPDLEACVIRVNASGDVLWSKTYDLPDTQAFNAVVHTSDGHWAVAGRGDLTVNGANLTQPLLAKIDKDDGHLLWSQILPLQRLAVLHGITEGPDKHLYAVGNAQRSVSKSGAAIIAKVSLQGGIVLHALIQQDSQWEGLLDYEEFIPTYGGDSAYDTFFDIVPVKGGFVISGFSGLDPNSAAWVAKVNYRLGVDWFNVYDGPEAERFNAVAATDDGILVSGWSNSLTTVGPDTEHNWLWAMKLPFEGGIDLLEEMGITSRYLQPGVRDTTFDPAVVPDYALVANFTPYAMNTADGVVNSAAEVTNLMDTPSQLCVTKLTASGHVSPLDACDDTRVDSFRFKAITDAPPGAIVESGVITLRGIDTGVPIQILGGEYRINGGAYTDQADTAQNGDTLQVRHTASTEYLGEASTEITIGAVTVYFTSTSQDRDSMPELFTFNEAVSVQPESLVESDPITLSGINAPAQISVSNGEYSIDGADFTDAPGTVQNGAQIIVRTYASSALSTSVTATLTVDVVNTDFVVTTANTLGDKPVDRQNPSNSGKKGGGSLGWLLILLAFTLWREKAVPLE